jgi:hypothetical protein
MKRLSAAKTLARYKNLQFHKNLPVLNNLQDKLTPMKQKPMDPSFIRCLFLIKIILKTTNHSSKPTLLILSQSRKDSSWIKFLYSIETLRKPKK